jgi:hypothetical protein
LDSTSLSLVVQLMPTLLHLNVETNLEPTIRFYEECVGLDAARMYLAKDPSLCAYSLENRLKPRLAEGREAGIPIDTGTISRMARCPKDQWSISMAFQKTKLLKQQQLKI